MNYPKVEGYIVTGIEGTDFLPAVLFDSFAAAQSYVETELAQLVKQYVDEAYYPDDEDDAEALKEFNELQSNKEIVAWGQATDIISDNSFVAYPDFVKYKITPAIKNAGNIRENILMILHDAIENNQDKNDAYMKMLQLGYTVSVMREYAGDKLADDMEKFCAESGFAFCKDSP